MRSRHHISDFALHRPTTLDEAASLMRSLPGARPLGGGIDLLDAMKWGEPVAHLIELRRVAGLSAIRIDAGALLIGAAATHAAIAGDPLIAEHLPDLARLWGRIASPRIRFSGTLGGNLMAGRPHYDGLPALMALQAKALVAGDPSWHPVEEAVRLKGALLIAVRIDRVRRRRLLVGRELHPAVAVYLGISDDDAMRVAVGGAHQVVRCAEVGPGDPAEAAAALAARMPATLDDGGASAAWRTRMIGVLAEGLLRRQAAAA